MWHNFTHIYPVLIDLNYWARYNQERQVYSLYSEYHSYILCSYIFAIRIELLYIRTNEVRENINSVYITCKNSIEQSRVESKHIFSGFSRKENMFVYFLFIQLNGIFSIFKERPSWSLSYGSSLSVTCDRSMVLSGSSGVLYQ